MAARGTRLRALSLAIRAMGEGAVVRQVRSRATGEVVCEATRPVHVRGEVFMYLGSVTGRGWSGLCDSLTEYLRRLRENEAAPWRIAAFDAAAQGYDVREPCAQLQAWIDDVEGD